MPTDIKLSKAQISKVIQSGGSFGYWLGKLGKKALINKAFPLARDNLPELVNNLTSNPINKFEKKNKWKRTCNSTKSAYFISNEDMNDMKIRVY